MKKITISKSGKVAIVIGAVIILGIAGGLGFRAYRVNALLNEQNYIASRLIEMGDYTKGSILATQSEQMKKNDTSEALIVLAAGLNADYDIATLYADRYLQENNVEVINSAQSIVVNYQESLVALEEAEYYDYDALTKLEETTYNELLTLLLQVQSDIPVKKSDETIVAVTNYMAGMSSSSTVLTQLADDYSLLSRSVQAECALNSGNYEDAFAQMETLVNSNATFEYKAKMANMAVNTSYNAMNDEETMQLQTEQAELNQNLYELYNTLNQEANSIKKGELEERIQKLEAEIKELQEAIRAIPAKKAINYIEATTSITERGSKAYQLELAQLYFMANDNAKAKDILQEMIVDEDDSAEAANVLLQNMKNYYIDKDIEKMNKMWEQLAGVLGFEQGYGYYPSGNEFYQFMQTVFDSIYNGLIIRDINTKDYPVVKVTLNVATELDSSLKKRDISLLDLGENLSKFNLIPASEADITTEMTVELVVDISGSMGGTPLEDTKKAVNNFIQNLDADMQVGVVAFDHAAYVIAPISDNHSAAIRGVNELTSMGGTSIYSGLQKAGEELGSRSGKKVIILMSDGEDGSYIEDLLKELNQKNIIVYTIGFGGINVEYLSHIATSCGGKFIHADSSQMLSEIYAAVGEYMVNDYILEFTAESDVDNYDRNLKITLDKEGIFAGRDYHIGVTFEEIQAEEGLRPQADYYQEIGGSDMNAGE